MEVIAGETLFVSSAAYRLFRNIDVMVFLREKNNPDIMYEASSENNLRKFFMK